VRWANVPPVHARFAATALPALQQLRHVAASDVNVFGELVETIKVCPLGQISGALYQIRGQYRRNV
jgi:isobutyryl-CoA mutase